VRRLDDRSDKAGTTIDENATARDTREMSGRVEAVEDVGVWLKQLQRNG
jgi:hypothetical protein